MGILRTGRTYLPELAARPDAAAVRDYVLIHELMHLRRLDHSKAYWRLVAAACPEIASPRGARQWLAPERTGGYDSWAESRRQFRPYVLAIAAGLVPVIGWVRDHQRQSRERSPS